MRIYDKGFIVYNGELRTFKPIEYKLRFFPEEVCLCTAEIGVDDDKTIVELDMSRVSVYINEAMFKTGERTMGDNYSFKNAFYSAFGFTPNENCNGTYHSWTFRDGEAQFIDVSDLEFRYKTDARIHKVFAINAPKLYDTPNQVYLHNDYTVDGEVRVSPKTKLELTDEQYKYVKLIKESIQKLQELNTIMVFETSKMEFIFANRNNVESFTVYDPEEDFIDASSVVEVVESHMHYADFDDEGSFYVKLKN